MIADQWDISREELDAFSVRSHQRAARATAEGRFENEIVPVAVRDDEGNDTDEIFDRRRGHPPGLERRGPGQAQARLQGGRQGHGGQLLADHRRGLGRADHERGEGQRARAAPAGPLPRLRPGRRRPGHHADRPHPRDDQRAGAGQAHPRRHRRGGDQRGVRLGGAGVGEGAPPRHGDREPQRWRHRPRAPARVPRAAS